MSNIITLKINADDVTGKNVANAVRRAFASHPDNLPESGEVKGVRFSVRQAKPRTASKPATEASLVRSWARQNNVPVGQRGRIHPDVHAAYRAAQVS